MKFKLPHFEIISLFFGKKRTDEKDIIPLTPEEEKKQNEEIKVKISTYNYIKDLSEEHAIFLYKISEDEQNRQNIIESKLAQIIGQSGIILTLISLFAPLFYEKLDGYSTFWRFTVLILFILGFVFFLISILQATKTFNIRSFVYSRPSINAVIDGSIKVKEDFIKDEIKNLFIAIPINGRTNSFKGNLLLYSHRAFVVGFLCIGLLGIIITPSFVFHKEEKKIITVQNIDEINTLELRLHETKSMIGLLALKSDSFQVSKIKKRLDSVEVDIKNMEQKNHSSK